MGFPSSQSITPVKGVALWGVALLRGEVSIQDLIDDFFELRVQRLIVLGFLLDCVCYCSCGIDISITIVHRILNLDKSLFMWKVDMPLGHVAHLERAILR